LSGQKFTFLQYAAVPFVEALFMAENLAKPQPDRRIMRTQ
jgi:hypothetical protein